LNPLAFAADKTRTVDLGEFPHRVAKGALSGKTKTKHETKGAIPVSRIRAERLPTHLCRTSRVHWIRSRDSSNADGD